jgi:hypothetical protein
MPVAMFKADPLEVLLREVPEKLYQREMSQKVREMVKI